MFGGKKRFHTKDQEQNQATKKKWQEEIEDEMDEGIPEDLEIPKDLSDEENNINDDKNEQDAVENIEPEQNVEEHKQKAFDWMTSEDEMNAEEEQEDDQKLTKENGDHQETEEIIASKDEELESDSKDARTLFISNIPLDASDEQILDKFRIFGTIMNIEVPRNEGSRLNKGRAFIEFSSIEDAQEACEAKLTMKDNLLTITLGLNTAIQTVTAAQKETPFVYDERTRKYMKAGEIEARKKAEEEAESSSGESDSSSGSDSGSGSGSGSDSEESESDDEEKLIKRKKKTDDDEPDDEEAPRKHKGRNRKNSPSRSRSQSKSPTRVTKLSKRR